MMTERLTLNLPDFTFTELFHSDGLHRLDQVFQDYLGNDDPDLLQQLLAYRHKEQPFTQQAVSELLIRCSIVLERFLIDFFGIGQAAALTQAKTLFLNPISTFKKYFVLKRAKKELNKADNFPPFEELENWLQEEIKHNPLQAKDDELAIGFLATRYLETPDEHAEQIEKLAQWCVRALTSSAGKAKTKDWVSFRIPERLDYNNLVPTEAIANDKCGRVAGPEETQRHRDGFKLTDARMTARAVQDEVNYCIYCHDHDGDFCSKGFPVKKGDPAQGFKKNPLDITLTGCPLEEKISEMNYLKQLGHTIAPLSVVMIDNPMCPATGHRICNDCMKACIYQKQDPVNIPQIETRVLTDVLDLPWGVEIYDLLTRWNPLRQDQWVMKPYNGLKIMIAGMGPAGFTLAHHLLLEGFAIVGFDGLKIEPLPNEYINQPIYRFKDLKESLDERLMAGFGGVAEYGITVRWDKNFLKLIYISLMRRPHFQVFGGVRFGGTITVEDVWEMGFDHLAVAVGAGLPKALSIAGSMAPGMRQANDFLMALQLGNAAKSSSLTNLQIRLPAVIIGGGLTGVDTATEVQAYYITQVEKILHRYEKLVEAHGEDYIQQQLDAASREILNEYLQHGRAVRKERERAKANNEVPNFIKLAHEWGGVTIAYRRSMQESPAYVNNHEELIKALQEGIYYAEGLEPSAVDLNKFGHSEALICHKRLQNADKEWVTTQEEVRLPARSILVATGTQPNTAYEFEHRGTFNRLNLQYQHYEDEEGNLSVAHGVEHCKDPAFGPFTSYSKNDKRISLIGDTHPVFHGNVVKAIASGMRTYPKIVEVLKTKLRHGCEAEYQQFAAEMEHVFQARVTSIKRKSPGILELDIQAPLAAKHFKAGQFYRLQNFETYAPRVDHTLFQMEPIALVTAGCDRLNGILKFIVREESASAKLCATLKPNEPVSLMGPAGVKAKIPGEHETILIVGTPASFSFVRSFGREAREAGNHVIFVAQLNSANELFSQHELEQSADMILWLTADGSAVETIRPQDHCYQQKDGIDGLLEFANANNLHQSLADVDRIYLIGDTELMRHFQVSRKNLVKDHFHKDPKVFAAVYGNMQCMLKGVCAQCLQWQIDPETGLRTKAVFACSWQDQPLEIIDIDHMDARKMQNSLHEQMGKLWVDYVFDKYAVARV